MPHWFPYDMIMWYLLDKLELWKCHWTWKLLNITSNNVENRFNERLLFFCNCTVLLYLLSLWEYKITIKDFSKLLVELIILSMNNFLRMCVGVERPRNNGSFHFLPILFLARRHSSTSFYVCLVKMIIVNLRSSLGQSTVGRGWGRSETLNI